MGNVSGKAFQSGGSNVCMTQTEHRRLQRRFYRLSHGQDRIKIRKLAEMPELGDNFFVQRLFELYDADGDGILLYEEFVTAMIAMHKLEASTPQERLELAFKLYDIDGDGIVDAAEMATVLAHTSARCTPEAQLQSTVQHTVAAHDTDGDGCLAPHEFRDLVMAASPTQPAAAVAAC